MARVYVSSTFNDLKECREKVMLNLKQVGHEDIAMEYYVAQGKRPVDKCLEDVASCDLYIGIFAWKYGNVPDGCNKSFTELEYRKAVEAGKECLIFLLHEDALWSTKFVDIGKDAKKIRALRNELSGKYMASFFKSADELASLVGAAVINWESQNKNSVPGEHILEFNNKCRRYERKFRGLWIFTKANLEDAKSFFQSGYLKKQTYGTSDTPYSVINNDLVLDIRDKISEKNFFYIYGNSGRGKTFFIFNFIQSVTNLYDTIIYYSPQFRSEKDSNLENLFVEVIEGISFLRKRILFVVDDFHLINDQSKSTLLDRELGKNNKLSVLIVSRDRENINIPSKYRQDKYFKNFNNVAERLFEQILQNFKEQYKLVSSDKIEDEIRKETDGGNLVFLTLLLQSWSDLLPNKKDISFEEIRRHAYSAFCNYYERNHSENWKYINHIVSALYQYEIKIDKNYLTPENNKNLAEKGLQVYLQDRLIHNRMIHNEMIHEEGDRLFYVFMDFAEGEEKDMMKHASEFRFYLEAYGNNLVFGESRNLNRIEFTQYVLKDCIQFKPCNIQEVFANLYSNAGERESEIMLDSLIQDQKCKSISRQNFFEITKEP